MLDQVIKFFVVFFVVVEPVSLLPLFVSLTEGANESWRRRMARKAVFLSGAILFVFALAGAGFLQAMGISLEAFRIFGGLLLFLIALEMVFEKRQQRQKDRADHVLAEEEAAGKLDDISVFPLGIPMIAGPGSIATAMLYMQNANGDPVSIGITAAAIGANLVLTCLIFLAAGPLMKVMGQSIAGAITRIFGVILAALAVQLIVDGIIGAFGLMQP